MKSAQLTIDLLEQRPEPKPSPAPTKTPAQERDETLSRYGLKRENLIREADRIARILEKRDGGVTADRIRRAMVRNGWINEGEDTRWLGAVLLPSRGWERTGELVPEGSKARPVPVWKRR